MAVIDVHASLTNEARLKSEAIRFYRSQVLRYLEILLSPVHSLVNDLILGLVK